MTYEQLFKQVTKGLHDTNKIEALKLLLLELVGEDSAFLYLHYQDPAPKDFEETYQKYASMYLNDHIPIQHILGYSYFFGRKFNVSDAVLIPRPETENLVSLALAYYDTYFFDKKVDVLDLGTGSGAISITLDLEESNMQVTASDISEEALMVAKSTQENLESKVTFIQSDWFKNIEGTFDIITANPPYIPKLELVEDEVTKEPSLALYGGNTGLEFYEAILKDIRGYLKPRAVVVFEHGYNQKEALTACIHHYIKDANVKTYQDLAGKDRNTVFVIGSDISHDI